MYFRHDIFGVAYFVYNMYEVTNIFVVFILVVLFYKVLILPDVMFAVKGALRKELSMAQYNINVKLLLLLLYIEFWFCAGVNWDSLDRTFFL